MVHRHHRRSALVLCVLLGFCLLLPRPAVATPGTTVDAYLEAMVAAGVPGVAVVVTRGDEVLVATGRGTSGQTPVTATTRFRAESLSKSVTATAVLQLVEQDRVDLDQPLATYLPELETSDPRSDRITVRQVLNQSSGLTDATLGFDQYAAGPTTARQAVALLHDSRLAYDPGTSWDYCNPNYWLAARLVEVVSGQVFSDYLRQHVFAALGMANTRQVDVPAAAQGVARSHAYAFGQPVHLGEPDSFAGGAGGVITTADDLGRWLRFQHGHRVPGQRGDVLGDRLLREQHRRQSPLDQYAVGYALGWWDGEPADGGVARTSHSGTGAGTSAYQGLFPAGLGIGVLVNADRPRGDVIAAAVHTMITRGSAPDVVAAPSPWPDALAALVAAVMVALCLRGVRRARTWALRGRRSRRWTSTALTALLSATLLAAPWIGSHLLARQAGWTVLWFTAPVIVTAVLAVATGLLILTVARAAAQVQTTRAPATPAGG